MTIKTQPETEEELMFDADRADGGDNDAETELPIMDFMSSIEVLIVDRVDALTMQNYENCRDVVNAVNEKPVATITADINRIESKFLSVHSAKAARQTVLVAGSIMLGEYQSLLRKDRMETVGDSVYSGASLSRALKLKIKQQFFIRIPVPGQSARNEQLMLYFKNKFWKEIGNEIKNMVIVVADTADFAPFRNSSKMKASSTAIWPRALSVTLVVNAGSSSKQHSKRSGSAICEQLSSPSDSFGTSASG